MGVWRSLQSTFRGYDCLIDMESKTRVHVGEVMSTSVKNTSTLFALWFQNDFPKLNKMPPRSVQVPGSKSTERPKLFLNLQVQVEV